MAQQQIVEWVDDLAGERIPDSTTQPTVRFGLGGVEYEIDLTEKNREELEDVLQPFISAGRRVPKAPNRVSGSRIQPPPRVAAKEDPAQRKAIRDWWEANWKNAKLPKPGTNRGRIPGEVRAAYTAHGGMRVAKPIKDPFKP